MRLHDVQVVLSAADSAKMQQVQQQQMAHVARAQDALSMNAEDEIKKTQIRQAVPEENIKAADDNRQRQKEWRLGRRREEDKPAGQTGQTQGLGGTSGQIIDIRA